ncbi:uncharacterized protein [Dysidea avara]|uniref:uncharacterized protein n=1 Tax=Dysidea avara TaxID=196820 RepID=UPI0033276986
MQLVVKKSNYWKSLAITLQDGRMPNIANHSVAMEPAIWFKVQLLESISVDCDRRVIAWTMKAQSNRAGRMQILLAELECPILTRSLIATPDDADLDRIFTEVEKLISSYKESSNMTTKIAEDWAHLLHNSMLPQITLLPCDLPLLEKELIEQNNLLKIIDEELVEKSQIITELRDQLLRIRKTIIPQLEDWLEIGEYSVEFIELFKLDIKTLETDARNKCSTTIKQLELRNICYDSIERLKKEKAAAVIELTHLLQVRSQIDIICGSIAPQSTNSLQEQYLEISESIDLHRKARSALNKDRILMVSVREALNGSLKGLKAGQITTGIDQGVDGGMAFDVLPKRGTSKSFVSVHDAFVKLLNDSQSAAHQKHKLFLSNFDAMVSDYQISHRKVNSLLRNGHHHHQQSHEDITLKQIACQVHQHFEEMIEVALESCDIGSIDDESFRQQAWICYERMFYAPYGDSLIKLYQKEKRQECEKLSLNKSNIDVKCLSIPTNADWLNQFAVQSLSTKSEDLSSSEEFTSFMDDIKYLEYSHTPLNKTQLLTSAFHKSELVINKLKITASGSGGCVCCDELIPFLVACLLRVSPDLRCLIYVNCCFLIDFIPPFLTTGWHGYSHTSFQAACEVAGNLLANNSDASR